MLEPFFAHLRSINFSPSLVFDIGAYEGAFSDACRQHFPGVPCWAFEPNLAKRAALVGKADRVFTDVLADAPADVTYWESTLPEQSGNSILKEHTNVTFRPTARRATDIDSLVAGRVPDLVKLDTQGSELAIFRGGRKSICQAEVVITEAHIKRYNEGAPLFHELLAFMDAEGFAMIDIADALRVQGILIQSNVMFLKRTSPAFTENAHLEFRF
jgi:FkbM family methyltransferase